jgi:hypothetical protein
VHRGVRRTGLVWEVALVGRIQNISWAIFLSLDAFSLCFAPVGTLRGFRFIKRTQVKLLAMIEDPVVTVVQQTIILHPRQRSYSPPSPGAEDKSAGLSQLL